MDALTVLYLIAIGWMYVVLLMTVVEATAPQGGVLGAVLTFVFYGILPLAILLYILNTPGRRRALRARESVQAAQAAQAAGSSIEPDGSGHPAGQTVAAKREEA